MRRFSRSILVLFVGLCMTALIGQPAFAQYDIDYRDNGTVVETQKIGNTTYRTTTTSDGTVYRGTRTQIGNTIYYNGTSSDGWSYDGSSYDGGSVSWSNTDYYDFRGSFTGSSSTTTIGNTTFYEGYDGGDYSYDTSTSFDYDDPYND